MTASRLRLTWYNQDRTVLPDGEDGYEWVGRDDPRVTEVRLLEESHRVGSVEGTPGDNLLIHGDAFDALHALVRTPEYADEYRGKVKLVYIDPPFNTSKAFEHYDDGLDHSIWLSMMRDRLALIADLLAPDGSVWVHLDDVEVHRARMLLDSVFGASAFICEIAWRKVAGRDNRTAVSKSHDFILVYAPLGKQAWRGVRNLIPRTQVQVEAAYSNPDNDPRGVWTSGDISAKAGPRRRKEQFFTIELPSGRKVDPAPGRCWLYTEDRYDELLADNRFYFGEDGDNVPRIKRFLSEVQDGLVPTTWWPWQEVGSNDTAKKEIRDLFPGATPFDTPKPEALLKRIIQIGSNPGDIVLDCFAGSATTAAVAHKLGRRWVAVEVRDRTVKDVALPRLTKVVDGSDQGGVSLEVTRTASIELPDEVTAAELDDTRKVLSLLLEAESLDVDEEAIGALLDQLKTKPSKRVLWSGGGGFRLLKVADSRIVMAGGQPLLTDATAAGFDAFVAAQLGYRLVPGRRGIAGIKGRDVLVAVPGVVDEEVVRYAISRIDDDQTVTIAGTGTHPGAQALLSALRPGSRVTKAPQLLVKRAKVTR